MEETVWTRYERRSKVQRVTEAEMIVMWARFNRVRKARIVFEVCKKGGPTSSRRGSQRWTV